MRVAARRTFTIGNGDGWSFVNGPWTDGPEGELIPPEGRGTEYFAVAHDQEYSDVNARFRFKFRSFFGGARFLFRVQDSMRYYALDIPWCGQQNRNRHFWAGIVLADGTPLQRYLHLGLVPGICPQHDRWYEARVECTGRRIRAWIDGRLAVDVEDGTYATGRVGLMGLITDGTKTSHFAALEVEGTAVDPSPWAGLTPPPKHWITPCRKVDPEAYQSFGNIIKSKSGELVVGVPFGMPGQGTLPEAERDECRFVWVRSTDGGRTWSDPEPAGPEQMAARLWFWADFDTSFVKEDGTWVCVHFKEDAQEAAEALCVYESGDEGRTWTGPKPLNVRGEWPKELTPPIFTYQNPMLRLRDGTLLLAVMCNWSGGYYGGRTSTNFVFRSTDDGQTWEAPVRCDSDNGRGADSRWFCPGDFSESGMAEVADNVILGFGRPGPWPYMWQMLSKDGGKTWEPAAFAPFPGYCITLTRTASGALVAIHRFPYLTANVSHDGGLTWDAGTIIDYPIWSNHHAVEAEPDVVVPVYMGHMIEKGQTDVRLLRLRVTKQGLVLAD